MDDRHLKCSYSDLENAGVISASWGIFKFLKIVLNQLTPIQEVLFFPKNGMRFIINLGYVNEKINAFGQVVFHFKGKKKKKTLVLLFSINRYLPRFSPFLFLVI